MFCRRSQIRLLDHVFASPLHVLYFITAAVFLPETKSKTLEKSKHT